MKRLFTLLAIVAAAGLTFSCGGNATKKNDGAVKKADAPERQGYEYDDPALYGDVESVIRREYVVEEKFGEVVKGEMDESLTYRFNKRGDVIEKADYNSDGSLDDMNLYKYDSAGNMIEFTEYDFDGSLDVKFRYKYDSAGNMIEVATYFYGRLAEKLLHKYDSAGNKIEEAEYNSDGSLNWKRLYKYDSAGNIIENTYYKGEIMEPKYITEYEIVYR